MKRLSRPQSLTPAFSVVEMLIVVAVIGALAATAIAFFGKYHREVMLKVRNQRNAQEICALVMGATAAGADVIVQGDMRNTVMNIIEGRKGTVGPFKGHTFKLSSLTDEEIDAAVTHLVWIDGLPSYHYTEE